MLSRAAGGTTAELLRPFCAGAVGLDRSTIFVAGAWKPFMANTRPFGTAAGAAYADGCWGAGCPLLATFPGSAAAGTVVRPLTGPALAGGVSAALLFLLGVSAAAPSSASITSAERQKYEVKFVHASRRCLCEAMLLLYMVA